jgi:phosphoserine phosphatase RsbU/P
MPDILVIDDDIAIQLVLKRALERQGYRVTVAENGCDGLLKARKLRPSVIICDWVMPMMDGLEVCRQVKQDPLLATTYFILLTSRNSITDRVRGLDNGADDFLSKPLELAELTARLRAALRIQQLTHDLRVQTQLLESEFAEAGDYIRSLLPKPLQEPLPIASCFVPSSQLGGDCFDYFWLDDDRLVVFLLDVSGHGLGAALLSVAILNLLRSQGLNNVDFGQPSQVLAALNRFFQMSDHRDKYFTIWYGVYHCRDRQLRYSSAGHPPASLVWPEESTDRSTTEKSTTDKAAKESKLGLDAPPLTTPLCQSRALKTAGFPIGLFETAEFKDDSCRVPPQSRLYIFSDGAYEIEVADGELLGLEAFTEILAQLKPSLSTLAPLLDRLQRINGSKEFRDDVSIIQLGLP